MAQMKKTRRSLLIVLAGIATGTLVGCAGHGQYTSQFKEEAELRLADLKAATEWNQAKAQFLAGDLEKALQTVDTAIGYQPDASQGYLLRGRILIELGRLEKAMNSLEIAIEKEPTLADAHYFKGLVFERISKTEDAYGAYMEADAHDPTNGQYLLAAGEMLIEMNRLEEAWALLDGRRTDFEHNAGIRQTLGHLATMLDRPMEAVTLFQEAHLLAPDDNSLLEDLIRAQMTAGKFAEAESNLRLVFTTNELDDRRDLLHLRVRCLLELDRPVDARGILQTIVRAEDGRNDIAAWVELGNVACILDDRYQLREASQRLISLAPRRHEGHLFMAMWNRSEGKLDSALTAAQRAVVHGRDLPAPLAFRGLIEMEMGQYEASLQSLEAALHLDPNDPSIHRMVEYVTRVQNGG